MLSVKLVEPDNIIERKMLEALVRAINKNLNRIANKTQKEIGELIARYILDSEIADQLRTGNTLAAHFGLRPGQGESAVDQIATTIQTSIKVRPMKAQRQGKQIKGGFEVGFLREDLVATLNSLAIANIYSNDGSPLPWLDWLLTRGDDIIVTGHSITFSDDGRSGLAVMVQDNSGFWRVPPEYSGTEENNWLTREIVRNSRELSKQIGNIFRREMK